MQSINVVPSVPNTVTRQSLDGFLRTPVTTPAANVLISGVTKNATGTPLASCAVDLYNTATDIREQTTVSDASGNYVFTVDRTQRYYCVAYLPGAPDVAGTTVNTLVGV